MNGTDARRQPVSREISERLLDPFIAAAIGTLRDWAGAEAVVRETYRRKERVPLGDIAATLELSFPEERGMLVLDFPKLSAAALAQRVLAESGAQPDDSLVRDCVGEFANVTGGQAKALLHGSPFRIVFATPKVLTAEDQNEFPWPSRDWLVALFVCDFGEFALQLCSKAVAG